MNLIHRYSDGYSIRDSILPWMRIDCRFLMPGNCVDYYEGWSIQNQLNQVVV